MAKKGQQESAKTKNAKRAKQADDKTFGLKNKNKSSKVQNFVKQVEQQAATATADQKRREAEQKRKAAEKKAAEQAKLDALKLFGASIQQQKVPFGVDPKSILCAFFKQGLCTKGAKCKFSHDLNVERKGAKKDLYTDEREDDKKNDTMDKWDEEKLKSVILSKHGNPKTTTDIVCKYFLEAVENGKYGWFWVCPNGGDTCKYRHSLPPGFKLKTKEELRLEKLNAQNELLITIEEFIEEEKKKLPKNLTPVTLDTFTAWKKERIARREREALEAAKKRKGGMLSGRQLMDSGKYTREESDDEDAGDEVWDLDALRRETERAQDVADAEANAAAEAAANAAREGETSYIAAERPALVA